MLIIPAIDIKNGNCVRLLQGDPDRETVYFNDPVSVAKSFEEQGAELIHVVDLDGAFKGYPVNKDIVIKIARSVRIPIEIGGGIRTIEAAGEYISAGIKRIILGTVVLEDSFKGFIRKYSEFIVAGIDAKGSMIATHGWKNVSHISSIEFIQGLLESGISEVIYTDIATDGMLTGPNLASIEIVLEKAKGVSLIASGGISTYDDIIKLKQYEPFGLKGCITGKAIYEKTINLKNAIEMVK
ncbi:MAG: 1-(5-phosphoribosyl)-5-[(5-phosphoribosylamino)methylideneamino]imidazole-4-carboxamide isomerase [Spirochaetes bacterium]|nr:1-(5-phosphoribosyl)-5-[(5-phosphoribosylamino)methylideneamino]imidazole-4-carboxamide isomerase [Spirochaetota bacterium]